MTLLHDSFEAKKFDVRVVQRNIDRGMVNPSEYQKSVDQLPDDSQNAEWVSIEELAQDDKIS